MAVQWQERDQWMERFLDRYSIPWHYDTLPASKINLDQGRFTVRGVDEDTAVRYAIAMENGDVFPPICVMLNGKENDMGQGRHRFGAAHDVLGEKSFHCLVAETTTDQQRHNILFFGNKGNGLGYSKAEAVQWALEYLRRYPDMTVHSVAQELGIRPNAIHDARTAEKTRRILKSNGVRKADQLSNRALRRLNSLRKSESVMVEAAKTATATKMPDKVIEQLVSAVNREKDDKTRMLVVETFSQTTTPKTEGPLRRKSTLPRDELQRALDRLHNLTTMYPDAEALCLHTPHLHKQMADKWRLTKEATDKALGLS